MKISPITANVPAIDLVRASETQGPQEARQSAFTGQLHTLMEDLEKTTKAADDAGEGLIAGRVELHQAMVSMEKANIALRVGTTVRNKILDAYRQLSQVSS